MTGFDDDFFETVIVLSRRGVGIISIEVVETKANPRRGLVIVADGHRPADVDAGFLDRFLRAVAGVALVVLLAACGIDVPNHPSALRSFTCRERFACGPAPAAVDRMIYGVCLDGNENEWVTPAARDWRHGELELCANVLPTCDYPNCFIVCRADHPSESCD